MKTSNAIDVHAILKDMARDTKIGAPKLILKVEVTVDPEEVVKDFSRSYYYEMQRLNPLKMPKCLMLSYQDEKGQQQEFPFDEEAVYYYFEGILKIRVDSCTDKGTIHWRIAKMLAVPSVLETAISMLGNYVVYSEGRKFVPKMEFDYDINKLLAISRFLESFESDGLYLLKDAFPRYKEGNPDVMSFIIVNDVVCGKTDKQTIPMSFISGFLGLKLQEAILDQVFIVPYENESFIRESWTTERRLVCS